MKTRILYSVLFILFITSASCQQQPRMSHQNPYNLKRLNWDMDVRKFYCESDETLVFDSDAKIIRGEVGLENSIFTIVIDSCRIYWQNDDEFPFTTEEEIIGMEYTTQGWRPDLYAATYGDITFPRLDIITDLDNQLIAVCATNDGLKNIEAISQLIETEKKTTEVVYEAKGGYNINRDLYKWEGNGYIYELLVEPPSGGYSRIEITEDEDGKLIDASTKQVANTLPNVYLFIVKKEYAKKVRKVSMGNFSNFY